MDVRPLRYEAVGMVRRLHDGIGIPDALIRPYKLARRNGRGGKRSEKVMNCNSQRRNG